MGTTIRLKRAYDEAQKSDGFRILVDRLWPRGISKERLAADAWARDIAPSNELRKWFGHDPEKWTEFRKRYRRELTQTHASQKVRALLDEAKRAKTITLLYGAKDGDHNEAVVLRSLFERMKK